MTEGINNSSWTRGELPNLRNLITTEGGVKKAARPVLDEFADKTNEALLRQLSNEERKGQTGLQFPYAANREERKVTTIGSHRIKNVEAATKNIFNNKNLNNELKQIRKQSHR